MGLETLSPELPRFRYVALVREMDACIDAGTWTSLLRDGFAIDGNFAIQTWLDGKITLKGGENTKIGLFRSLDVCIRPTDSWQHDTVRCTCVMGPKRSLPAGYH